MGKRRKDKVIAVEALKEGLRDHELILAADYRGLTVSEMEELRNRLRVSGTQFHVVKNSLAGLAAQSVGLEHMQEFLVGPTAIAISKNEAGQPAKILQEFVRDHKALEIKGGLLLGRVITVNEVKKLADLPSKEILLSRVLSGIEAPLVSTAGVLQAMLRNLVYVLDQVRQAKESA